MKINKHIQKLDYPEHTNYSSFGGNITCDLKQHKGRSRQYNYFFTQDEELIKKIAEAEKLKKENILITAGADAGLHHIAEVFLDEGKIAVIPLPSFGRFEFHTKVVGAKVIFIKHTRFPYSFDLKKITQVVKEKNADVIFIANPNNPTGELINKKRLKKFIKDNNNSLVIIDEVLIENRDDSIAEFVNHFKNLVVIKSFSKLFRAPGLRIGYLLANSSLLKMIRKTVSPYEVSSLSLFFLKRMLTDKKYVDKTKIELQNARNLLRKQSPLRLTNTQASVALIDAGMRDISLFDYLLKNGILSVDGKNFRGLERANMVRVIIDNLEDMKRLIKILKEYNIKSSI